MKYLFTLIILITSIQFSNFYGQKDFKVVFLIDQVYEKGNPKIEITVFDLKKKTQSTSTFYFSWFCEA